MKNRNPNTIAICILILIVAALLTSVAEGTTASIVRPPTETPHWFPPPPWLTPAPRPTQTPAYEFSNQ